MAINNTNGQESLAWVFRFIARGTEGAPVHLFSVMSTIVLVLVHISCGASEHLAACFFHVFLFYPG